MILKFSVARWLPSCRYQKERNVMSNGGVPCQIDWSALTLHRHRISRHRFNIQFGWFTRKNETILIYCRIIFKCVQLKKKRLYNVLRKVLLRSLLIASIKLYLLSQHRGKSIKILQKFLFPSAKTFTITLFSILILDLKSLYYQGKYIN